jgi:serine/threonine protein kinase/tetratricopeptide (TPR) repeat protein
MTEPSLPEESILLQALEIASLAKRAAFLDRACGENRLLRAEVEALLRAHAQSGDLLDLPEKPAVTVDEPSRERPGTVIGPYKLLQQIGEGGMGTVFLAEQTRPVQRKVALKVIKAGMDSAQVIARFEAEQQALAMMDHVNIARVLDAGTTEAGLPYFVMELVHGVPITKYCDDNHLTPLERLELFVPVCQAIQHAHLKGIIHRDIKPSNVLMALYDGKPVPKVIDFGVAKATEQKLTDRTLFTQYGTMVGTLEYMSPEQAEMNALGVDIRSDIFSLGVLLYELLTGSTPLSRKRLKEAAYGEILRLIKEEEPPRPSKRLSDSGEALASISANRHTEPAKLSKLIRGELDWIVMKTLEKDRNRRYESANGLAMDVQRYLRDEAVQACPPSVWYWFRKLARRHKAGVATAGLILCFIVLLGGGVGWTLRDQAARHLVVEQAVTRALDEANGLQKQGKWREALTAVERAEALLASGEAGMELQEQVQEQLADLHMIQRLEELRTQRGDHLDSRIQDRAYAAVFAEFGIDADRLSAAELAARIGRRPAHAARLAAALDDWAQVRQFQLSLQNQKHDPASWERLLEAACLADPDPWRCQLRQLIGQEDLSALRKLAASSNIAALPVQSLQLMGHALVTHGDRPACVAWLRKAQRQHPGDVIINFDLGWHLSELPSPPWDEVLRFYQAALAARPESERMHVWVGHTLLRMGRSDEALAAFSKLIELKADNATGWYGRGLAYANLRQWDMAIADFGRAIELKPDYADAWFERGKANVQLGQGDKAVADVSQGVETNPKSAQTWFWGGVAYYEIGRQDEAIAAYREAIRLQPADPVAHNNLGVSLRKKGRLDEAIAACKEAIRLEPGYALAHNNLGISLLKEGRLDEAIAEYREAIGCQPDDALAHNNLGFALGQMGLVDEAIAAYREAIRLKPDLASPHWNLSYLLANGADPKLRDAAEAVKLARKAVELAPRASRSWQALGWALYRTGAWKDSIEAFHKSMALQENPKGGDSGQWFGLAMAHWRLGDKEEARQWQDQAVQWMEKNKPQDEERLRFRAEAEALLKIEKKALPK